MEITVDITDLRKIEFDYARIRMEFGKLWLFLGEYKHMSEDKTSVWIDENGNKKQWSYIRWKVVADGETWKELIESITEYFRLCEMTMDEYLQELAA